MTIMMVVATCLCVVRGREDKGLEGLDPAGADSSNSIKDTKGTNLHYPLSQPKWSAPLTSPLPEYDDPVLIHRATA